MPKIEFLRPIDQPTGKLRLIHELASCLKSASYSDFRLAVGFVKVGPLARLLVPLRKWKESGKKIEAIFGIDQLGTSKQALKLALDEFDKVYVTRVSSSRQSTFHPKLYIFFDEGKAIGFYGSHNLTVGGTETNFEGGIKIELDRSIPSDEEIFKGLLECWNSLLPNKCPATVLLTQALFDEYLRYGLLLDESRPSKRPAPPTVPDRPGRPAAPDFVVLPPSAIPKEFLPVRQVKRAKAKAKPGKAKAKRPSKAPTLASRILVIQIVPHHNGEIFLSKNAINQFPDFFEYPFSGQTVPKKASNKSYPQRIPDPIVNILVYDAAGNLIPDLAMPAYGLNMVYYEAKSEIRITAGPELYRRIPSHSIMVMSKPDGNEAYDYDIDIYCPGSARYNSYLSVCNQTLPSGGAAKPRKMGWL